MSTHVSFYVLSWAISFILQFICVAIVGDKLSLLNISLGYYCCRNYLVVVKLAEELQEFLLAAQVLPNEVLTSVKLQLQLYVFYYLSVVFQFEVLQDLGYESETYFISMKMLLYFILVNLKTVSMCIWNLIYVSSNSAKNLSIFLTSCFLLDQF